MLLFVAFFVAPAISSLRMPRSRRSPGPRQGGYGKIGQAQAHAICNAYCDRWDFDHLEVTPKCLRPF